MTDRCADTREALLARDAGELPALLQERVDAHLRGCASCRALRSDLSALLAAGRAFAPVPTPEERDALYEAVARRASSPRQRPRTLPRLWVGGAVALVAAVVLTVLGAWMLGGRTPSPGARHGPDRVAPAVARRDPAASAALPVEPEPATASASPPTGGQVSPVPGLQVRAAPDTHWQFDRAEHRITLQRGAIWIAYHHDAGARPLRADGPGVRVTVTGTVLFLRTAEEGTDVGVLSGRVVVQPARGAAEPVLAGRVRSAAGFRRSVLPEEAGPASAWTSQEPLAQTARRSPAAAPRETSASTPPSADEMYRQAESALRAGDPGRAADGLRQLVQTWPRSPQAGTARLDLARLYAGPLHRPELAIAQLRRFLATGHEGAAAAAARAELCRLLPSDEREVETGCQAEDR